MPRERNGVTVTCIGRRKLRRSATSPPGPPGARNLSTQQDAIKRCRVAAWSMKQRPRPGIGKKHFSRLVDQHRAKAQILELFRRRAAIEIAHAKAAMNTDRAVEMRQRGFEGTSLLGADLIVIETRGKTKSYGQIPIRRKSGLIARALFSDLRPC